MNEMKPYEDLANAIIIQAINDYAYSDQRADKEDPVTTRNEVEAFFRGKWITCLTNVDPQYLLRVAKEKRKKVNQKNWS